MFARKDYFDGDAVGYWDGNTHEVAVMLPGPSPVAEADRIWHELLHAVSAIILPPDRRLDETQVNAIATAQIDLLQRNPSLLAFVVSRLVPESEPDPLSVEGGFPSAARTSVETTETPQ